MYPAKSWAKSNSLNSSPVNPLTTRLSILVTVSSDRSKSLYFFYRLPLHLNVLSEGGHITIEKNIAVFGFALAFFLF